MSRPLPRHLGSQSGSLLWYPRTMTSEPIFNTLRVKPERSSVFGVPPSIIQGTTVPSSCLTSTWIQLLILRCGLGFAVGGIMTLAYTIGGGAISRSRSTSFAILGSASLLGGAVGPMVSGLLAGRDLALPFILNAGLYVLLAVWTVAMIRVPLRQKGGPSMPAPARLVIRD